MSVTLSYPAIMTRHSPIVGFFSCLSMTILSLLVSGTLSHNLAARNDFVPGYPADVNASASAQSNNVVVSTPVSHPLADLDADSAV